MHKIIVDSKRKKEETLTSLYRHAKVIDVTSKGIEPFLRLSPFYPNGELPVPFSEGTYSESVEGIWQGLKVFKNEGIDLDKFNIRNMKGLKRTVKKLGMPLGHQKGIYSNELLDYIDARKQIYLPTYIWALKNKLQEAILELKSIARKQELVLLDYETNGDIYNPNKPLSHAYLIKYFIEEKIERLNS